MLTALEPNLGGILFFWNKTICRFIFLVEYKKMHSHLQLFLIETLFVRSIDIKLPYLHSLWNYQNSFLCLPLTNWGTQKKSDYDSGLSSFISKIQTLARWSPRLFSALISHDIIQLTLEQHGLGVLRPMNITYFPPN